MKNTVANHYKIAMIEPIGGHGGMEFYDFGLCEAISRQGHDVVLYTSNNTKLDEVATVNFPIEKVYCGVYGDSNKFLRGLRYLRGTVSALLSSRRRGAQLVHFQIFEFSMRVLIELILFRILGVKIVATVHDVEVPSQMQKAKRSRQFDKFFARLIDRFIVHSEYTKAELIEAIPQAQCKLRVVTHADIDFVFEFNGNKEQARQKLDLDLPQDAKVILFFGQIKEAKGLDLLLSAFSKLKGEKNTYLLIAGRARPSEMDKYSQQIERLEIADRIIFRSQYIANDSVPTYFASSDIIVLPYRRIYNSGVVLRAMHYGVPVVCSDLPAFTEVVRENITGFFFKSENEQSLVICLEYALQHPRELDRIKDAARLEISEKYSFDVVGREMTELYASLCHGDNKNLKV